VTSATHVTAAMTSAPSVMTVIRRLLDVYRYGYFNRLLHDDFLENWHFDRDMNRLWHMDNLVDWYRNVFGNLNWDWNVNNSRNMNSLVYGNRMVLKNWYGHSNVHVVRYWHWFRNMNRLCDRYDLRNSFDHGNFYRYRNGVRNVDNMWNGYEFRYRYRFRYGYGMGIRDNFVYEFDNFIGLPGLVMVMVVMIASPRDADPT